MVRRESTPRRHGHTLSVLALAALAAGIALLSAAAASAHGNPEVTVNPSPAPFGGEVTIEGEGFEEESQVSIVLEGALGEIALGNITTDEEGTFSLTVALPSGAAPGGYRVRAVSADEVAVIDLRIVEGEEGEVPTVAHEQAVGFHRVHSAAENAGFAALAAALGLLGGALLWFSGRKEPA